MASFKTLRDSGPLWVPNSGRSTAVADRPLRAILGLARWTGAPPIGHPPVHLAFRPEEVGGVGFEASENLTVFDTQRNRIAVRHGVAQYLKQQQACVNPGAGGTRATSP